MKTNRRQRDALLKDMAEVLDMKATNEQERVLKGMVAVALELAEDCNDLEDTIAANVQVNQDRMRSLKAKFLKVREDVMALQRRGELVITKNQFGQIVSVTRQNSEGQVLSVIAESAQVSPQ